MPPLTPVLGFIGPTYRSRIRTLDCERAVNLIPEVVATGQGTNVAGFLLAPGLTRRATVGAGQHRAAFQQDGLFIVVSGDEVYQVFPDETVILRGTVDDDGLPATISSNGSGGNQLLITSGGKGYIYSLSADTVTEITDTDFPQNVSMGVFFEGYFIVIPRFTARIHFSSLEDGSSWDGIDVAQKSITSDELIALAVDRRVLWLIGSKHAEPWYNSGDALNPLAPVPNTVVETGTISPFGVVRTSNTLYWLAGNDRGGRSLVALDGYSVKTVSTSAVEWQWSQYDRIDDCRAWVYEQDTHSYLVLQFPAADATWVYDESTGLWHERGWWDNGEYKAHLGFTHAFVYNRHYVGSRIDGALYELSDSAPDDDGTPKVWERVAPRIETGRVRAIHDVLELQAITGVGTQTGQGFDPQVMLDWSEDSGQTWSNEYWASLGRVGKGTTRVRWRQLGQSTGRNYRVRGSDPIITGLVNLWIGLRVGRS